MTSFHITPIAVVTLTKRGSITLYLEWPIYHPVLKFLNPRHIPGTGEASFQLSPWLQKIAIFIAVGTSQSKLVQYL